MFLFIIFVCELGNISMSVCCYFLLYNSRKKDEKTIKNKRVIVVPEIPYIHRWNTILRLPDKSIVLILITALQQANFPTDI